MEQRRIVLSILCTLCTLSGWGQFTEDFESGTSTISSSSGSYCNDGGSTGDYFDVGQDGNFTGNFTGNSTNFFAAQDIDGCGGNSGTETITWSGIDISGCSGLSLSVDLAEDDDGSSQDYDNSDYVHIDVSIDGGAFQPVIWVENDGSTYNSPPYIDTDFNGVGDGTEVTDQFQTFSNGISGTGSTLVIRITFALNSGDEDIAIDNITVTGSGCGGGTGPTTETSCSDGIDNDGDGDIDCADGDCSGDPSCATGGSGCTDGAIGVTGSGCGCLSGCNLTSFGGPNCSPSVGGNCDAGQTFMSHDIIVPDGCTYTVSAEMRTRPGCSASGADGGDQVKVDIVGGSKPYQAGSSNSTQIDSYTLAGPGTIRVSGTANRADEIITYTVSSSGPFCENCFSTLPIELLTFDAIQKESSVDLVWTTASEVDNDYFIIQRSSDGINFENYHKVGGIGNSSSAYTYHTVDGNPHLGISYYRLKQVDLNGDFTYSDTKSVEFTGSSDVILYPNPATSSFTIESKGDEIQNIICFNALGQQTQFTRLYLKQQQAQFDVTHLPKGTYVIKIELEKSIVTKRLIVTH